MVWSEQFFQARKMLLPPFKYISVIKYPFLRSVKMDTKKNILIGGITGGIGSSVAKLLSSQQHTVMGFANPITVCCWLDNSLATEEPIPPVMPPMRIFFFVSIFTDRKKGYLITEMYLKGGKSIFLA